MDHRYNRSFLAGLCLATALLVNPLLAQSTDPDNTKRNKEPGATADKQKMNAEDRTLTQNVRKAIMDDKTLSTYAHNVKIVARDGSVTLRGPVRSDAEKAALEAKAVEVAGPGKVTNELTVAPPKHDK
jgi:osmotically-inducible protein OsmY